LATPARKPFSCVPPEPVGIPLTKLRSDSSVASVHKNAASIRVSPSLLITNGGSCTAFF
jgi:hypothetical protein